MLAFRSGDIALWHGDATRLLPSTLAALRPAVVVVDPPYGIANSSGYIDPSRRRTAIAGDDDLAVRDAVLAWAEDRDIPVACFGSWRRPAPAGARARLVWDKGPCAGMGDLSLPWRDSAEDVFILGPGWFGHRGESVLRVHATHAGALGRLHPHEKPVALLVEILRKAPAGPVLDPCCGSGSTLLAARLLGRPAVGIELDERWIRVARERIAQGWLFTGAVA
jgi:site-specific DNA-methyltransferase (adenine-specific)